MKPLHLNLVALGCAIAIVTLVYLTLGNGIVLQSALTLFGLAWGYQCLLLCIAANAHRSPPPFVSKLTFALWAAAGYAFTGLMAPRGMFPDWFVVLFVPIGFLMMYAGISLFLWMLGRLPKWPLPQSWTQ